MWTRKNEIKRGNSNTSFSSVETWPKNVEILCWNLYFENKAEEEDKGLRLSLFHCGIIMMIKSLLQSYTGGMYTAEETASLLAARGSLYTLSCFSGQFGGSLFVSYWRRTVLTSVAWGRRLQTGGQFTRQQYIRWDFCPLFHSIKRLSLSGRHSEINITVKVAFS